MRYDESELGWMHLAIETARMSKAEPGRLDSPKVGAIVVRSGELLGRSWRGKAGEGLHAEYGLLSELAGADLSGASVFTTLEPCSRRNPPKTPCAQRLIDRGVTEVYIGMYDPNPRIYREGWRLLNDAGVRLRDFEAALRDQIMQDNGLFVGQFQEASGPEGAATFDYMQNAGRFTLRSDGGAPFETQWTNRGHGSIYAYDARNHVALARYAESFIEIDDPGALDWANHSVGVGEGEIVAFRNDSGYALVGIDRVLAGPTWGDDRTQLTFTYKLRAR